MNNLARSLSSVLSRMLDEFVRMGMEMVESARVTPSEAASRIIASEKAPPDLLAAFAARGLAEMVNDALQQQRRESRIDPGVEREVEREAEPWSDQRRSCGGGIAAVAKAKETAQRTQERRARLYHKVRAALEVMYAGADGEMRPLLDFSVADHRARLNETVEKSRGWKKAARFHDAALATLKAFNAPAIRKLPAQEQARLSALLS